MEIAKLYDKTVKVVCVDGQVFIGKLSNHTSSLDNDLEGESITIDSPNGFIIEIFMDEISSITKYHNSLK